MPLFSSKFAFKKSPQRRRNSPEENKRKHEDEEAGEEISSADSEEDEDEETEEETLKERSKSTDKRTNKSKRSQSSVSIVSSSKAKVKSKGDTKSAKKEPSSRDTTQAAKKKPLANSKQKMKNQGGKWLQTKQLVLCLDSSQDISFQFDVKEAVWKDGRHVLGSAGITGMTNQVESENSTQQLALNSELLELSNKNKALQEENRLLKLKIEILMEMVTETTAELNLKDKQER